MTNDKLRDEITTIHRCPKKQCKGKAFDSLNALRMHNMRVHTRAGQRGFKIGAKIGAMSRSKALARRRERQAEARAAFIAAGLTSQGKPRKRQSLSNAELTRIEHRRAYKRQWDLKHRSRKIKPIVFRAEDAVNEPSKEPVRVCFCPYCGNNIEKLIT